MKHRILLTIAVVISILAISHVSHASSVTIDAMTGSWSDSSITRLIPNDQVTFNIRYINNSGTNIRGMTNGFKIWTTGGTPFTPVHGEILHLELFNLFDLVFKGEVFSGDGLGTDIIGIGGSQLFNGGLPDGFNELVLKIVTGGVQEGETLCIDSSFYPPNGNWVWSEGIYPSWSGQQCFTAVCPGTLPPQFTNVIDTIKNINCNNMSFDFDAIPDSFAVGPPNNFARFVLVEGPGTLDTITGEWAYSFAPEALNTTDTLIVGTYDWVTCNVNNWSSILRISSEIPADFNNDCSTDISDLVLLVAYMFQGGAAPTPLMSADMNADTALDISDLVWLVAYMFQGGPQPIW